MSWWQMIVGVATAYWLWRLVTAPKGWHEGDFISERAYVSGLILAIVIGVSI